MNVALTGRLCRASEAKGFDPAKDVPWDIPFDERQPQAIPDSLLSPNGTPGLAAGSPDRRRTLARHEIATPFSVFVRFEGLLNENLARVSEETDPTDPFVAYALHVIEKEGRMTLARLMLTDTYQGTFRLERTAVQIATPFLLALLFDGIVPPHAYRRTAGVGSDRYHD